ncbi:MAG: CBS domain-containing protein [Flavobacteriales bacterium]
MGFTMLEDQNQKLIGIVSNADLRREILRTVDQPELFNIERMINMNPISIEPNKTVTEMLSLVKLYDFPINYLPVVDTDHRVKGVVSFLNLVKGEL